MWMRFIGAAALAIMATAGAAAAKDPEIKVTGCIVNGEDGGFLVADRTAQASNASGRVLYLLKDDDDWKAHAGQRVELKGEIEGDVEEGEIEIERKDTGVEIEIKSDGKTVKAMLPASMAGVVSGRPLTEGEVDLKYLVHKLDVKDIKHLGICA
jgi:hypothetical protein